MSLTTQIRRNLAASCIQHYGARFACININRACQILNSLGSGNDLFFWIGINGSKSEWNPNRILKSTATNDWYASNVYPIEFQGGPPNKWGTHSGNLLTLLLDRIAVMVLFEGVKALDGIIDPSEQYPKFT